MLPVYEVVLFEGVQHYGDPSAEQPGQPGLGEPAHSVVRSFLVSTRQGALHMSQSLGSNLISADVSPAL